MTGRPLAQRAGRWYRGPALVLALGLTGSPLAAQPADPVAQARQAILAASRRSSEAYVRNDTAGLGRVYADSAVLLPPGREVRGRAAIRQFFARSRRTASWPTR